ncbi:MAG: hypothetical protein ACK5H2_01535 [Beutenbergiaceae bacterium]
MLRFVAVASLVVAGCSLSAPALADDDDDDDVDFGSSAGDGYVDVWAAGTAPVATNGDSATSTSDQSLASAAAAYADAGLECLFRLGRDGTSIPTSNQQAWQDCQPDPTQPPIDLATLLTTEYQTLPLTPSPLHHQPDTGWALVNMDLIVYTNPTPQRLHTTLLGIDLTITATPVTYTWDFGDATPPVTTSTPGAPYPHHTITHLYTTTTSPGPGTTITLTTSWQGQFQITGTNTWHPIAGLATTTTTTPPIDIVAMTIRLIPNQQ